MDSVRFKEIIGAFLDSTDQFDTDKGQFVIQLGQEVISFTLTNVAGTLWVTEGIHKHTAEEWIITGISILLSRRRQYIASCRCCDLFLHSFQSQRTGRAWQSLCQNRKAMICPISKRFF
jgi:hypothetical protein